MLFDGIHFLTKTGRLRALITPKTLPKSLFTRCWSKGLLAAIFFLANGAICSPDFQAELEEKRRLAAEASPAGGDSHSDVGDRSGAEALVEGAGGEKAEGSGNDSDEDPKQKFSLDLKPPSLGHSAASSRGGSQAATPLKSPQTPKPSEEFLRFQVLSILFNTLLLQAPIHSFANLSAA